LDVGYGCKSNTTPVIVPMENLEFKNQ